ncbi:MAG: hypothetical protein OER91_02430 [Gammaproteobacteria bacterium]|nr:hypothetical protein [Gammaproteobacteria bacterium]
MPELSVIHIALMAATAVIGVIAGWILRGNRAEQEKAAVSAGWQEQIDAQRREGDRLGDQNKGLMEQVSQFQASHTDAKNRAKELSVAVQEAYGRRDELQREIKDIRSNLEVAVSERDQLQSDMAARSSSDDILREKDARIEKLTQELDNWQERLPPLIERFRVRNEEAERLEVNLEQANLRIRELEDALAGGEENPTRIEPVTDPDELTDGLDASNDEDTDESEQRSDDDDQEHESEPAAESEEAFESEAESEPEGEFESEAEPESEEAFESEAEPESEEAFESEAESEPEGVFESESAAASTGAPEFDPEPDPAIINEVEYDTGSFGPRDDLKMIKGVGPAIEKTLNEMGIVSFQQIADMSEYDIDRVARRLKGFRTRIYREDWIGQARELRDQAVHA